jgi:acetyltransferase-like isoleucine patch superfamily enzyme
MGEGPKRYDLKKIYGTESSLDRYTRLTAGEGASLWSLFCQELVTGLCGSLPGILGWGIRNRLYPFFFKGFHKKAFLGRNITLRCPRQMRLSAGVVVDDFVQLIATSRRPKAITIGEGTFLRSFAMLNSGPPEGFIHIGRNSTVGQGALLYGNGGLTIGNNVMIAGQSAIIASSHNYEDVRLPMTDQGYCARGITIYDNVWIGAGAKIMDGVSIGEGAIVGANAMVNRPVAPGERVGGIPASPLKGSARLQ